MTDNKHQGWTNYATWRIKLELFDSHDPSSEFESKVTADSIREFAEEAITQYGELKEDNLAVSYAMAFIDDVNWHEIAESINAELYDLHLIDKEEDK